MIATDEDTAAGGAHTHPEHTAAVAQVRRAVEDKYSQLTEVVRGLSENAAALPEAVSTAMERVADKTRRDADWRHQQVSDALRGVYEHASGLPDAEAVTAAVQAALEPGRREADARHQQLAEGLRGVYEQGAGLPDAEAITGAVKDGLETVRHEADTRHRQVTDALRGVFEQAASLPGVDAVAAAVHTVLEPARREADAWHHGVAEALHQMREVTSALPDAAAITAAVQDGTAGTAEALGRLDIAEEARHRAIVQALAPVAEHAGMLPGTAATVEAIAAGVSRAASTLASVDTAVAAHVHAAAGLPQAVAEHGAMLESVQSALGVQTRWLQSANTHHQQLSEQVGQICARGANHDEWFSKVAAILDSQGRAVLAAAHHAGEHAARVEEVLGDPEAYPGGIRARQDAHSQAIGQLGRICDGHGMALQQQTATLGSVSSTAGEIHKDVRGSLEIASRISSAVSALARMAEQAAKTQEIHTAALRQIWSVLEPAKLPQPSQV